MVFNVFHPMLNVHVVFWGTIAFALALAYAVHVLVEKPFAPLLKLALNGCIDAPKRLVLRLKPRAR